MMELSHIILRVADMDGAVAFYRDAVGLGTLTTSPVFSFFDAGSIRLALTVGEPPDPPTTTEVVLEVADVFAAFQRMSDRGVPFEVEPRAVTTDGGRALHAAHFRDPDGHLASITGWVDSTDREQIRSAARSMTSHLARRQFVSMASAETDRSFYVQHRAVSHWTRRRESPSSRTPQSGRPGVRNSPPPPHLGGCSLRVPRPEGVVCSGVDRTHAP